MREKKAASGILLEAMSRSTQALRLPSSRWHRNTMFCLFCAPAVLMSSPRPPPLPLAVYSSSRPLRSPAFCRHSSATCAIVHTLAVPLCRCCSLSMPSKLMDGCALDRHASPVRFYNGGGI